MHRVSVLILTLAAWVLAVFVATWFTEEGRYGGDFVSFHAAAEWAWEGSASRAYDTASLELQADVELSDAEIAFHYPPSLLALISPLGGLNFRVALIVWALLSVASIAATLSLARRNLTTVALIAPTFVLNFGMSQTGALLTGAVVGGLLLARTRPRLGSALLALALLKPQFVAAPLAYGLYRYRRDAAVGILAAVVCLTVIGIAMGPGVWADYVRDTRDARDLLLNEIDWGQMVTLTPALRAAGVGVPSALAIQAAFSIAVLSGGVLLVRRERDESLQLIGVTLCAILASPYAFGYDMLIVVVPIALYLTSGEAADPRLRAAMLFTCTVPLLAFLTKEVPGAPFGWVGPAILLALLVARTRGVADHSSLTASSKPTSTSSMLGS